MREEPGAGHIASQGGREAGLRAWGGVKGGLWGSAESLGLRYPRRRCLSQRQDVELHLWSCGKIAFSWGDSQLSSADLRKLRTLLSMVQRESFGVEGDESGDSSAQFGDCELPSAGGQTLG